MLAKRYEWGWGSLPINLSRRFYWLMEGRKLGSAECTFHAGLALVAGRGVRRDVTQGLNLIREAAQYPDALAVTALLDLVDAKPRERHRMVNQLKVAAQHRSPEACLLLGVLIQFKIIKAGTTLPLEYYRRAARAGNGAAMWNLHVCYATGLGATRSAAKARYWRRRAGENAVEPLESDAAKVGSYAWGRERLYRLPMSGPLALSSYEELSAVVSIPHTTARGRPRTRDTSSARTRDH